MVTGKARKSLYNSWKTMIHCCTNPKYHHYPVYGGRGIGVSKVWLESFDQFVLDMGQRPTPKHVLDRKDKEKDFCKENCRWSTKTAQSRNTRKSVRVDFHGLQDPDGKPITMAEYAERTGKSVATLASRLKYNKTKMTPAEAAEAEAATLITHAGETLPISAWAERAGLEYMTLRSRLKRKWSMDKALSTPPIDQSTAVTYQSRTQTLAEWCRELDLPYKNMYHRININGWSVHKAFTQPIAPRIRRSKS